MGEVHAWRDRATGREVAMKTIRGGRRDAIAALRFAREARVQAQLDHPSIVPVYDVGVDPDGALYFTMKRVRGHSLQRVLHACRAIAGTCSIRHPAGQPGLAARATRAGRGPSAPGRIYALSSVA